MFRSILRTAVLGAIVVSTLASSSPASATSWTTNGSPGGTPFSMTAPGAAFKITATGGKVAHIPCTTATATGSLFGPNSPGPSWTGVAAWTPSFTSCTTGGQPWAFACAPASLNALSFASGVTTASITGFKCHVTALTWGCGTTASTGITITGSLSGEEYDNATGHLTIPTSGQSLTSVWSAGGCTTLLGTSPGVTIWGRTPTPNTNDPETLVATVTSAFVPSISQP